MFFRTARSAMRPNGIPSTVKKMTNDMLPSSASWRSLNDISVLISGSSM
jgi:hypothetical protein